jgi:hypothetical protein
LRINKRRLRINKRSCLTVLDGVYY